jgi:hypothetical protein
MATLEHLETKVPLETRESLVQMVDLETQEKLYVNNVS